VAGRLDGEAAVVQVQHQVDRSREALVPLLPVQVAVRGRQELLRPQRAEQAAERSGQQQRPGAGLGALARDVDQGQLEDPAAPGERADDEVPGEGGPAGRADDGLHAPGRRHGRQPPGVQQPRAQLAQERVAGRARQAGLVPRGGELVGDDRGDQHHDQRARPDLLDVVVHEVDREAGGHHEQQPPHRAGPQQQTAAEHGEDLGAGRHVRHPQQQAADQRQQREKDQSRQGQRLGRR
jgi:hypothetical protein